MERENEVKNINIEEIIPNRFQPRLSFEPEALKELSESIKQYGIFQPLVVRRIGNKYEIIAGERRYKASTLAGFKEVPCLIVELDDNESAEVALVENLQRRDLTPIEEAKSYQKLIDRGYLTQDQLAKRMGKSQSSVANKIRLLNLDEQVQQALLDSKISERHARSLLSIKDKEKQLGLLNKIIEKRMTVRDTDAEVKRMINEENRVPDFIPFRAETVPANPINEEISIAADITPAAISMDELNKVDPTIIEEKPITIPQEELEPKTEEIHFVDIDKLTKSAQDLNKQEPRPDIMDLLRVEENSMNGVAANTPAGLYQPAVEAVVTTDTIPTIAVDQIPTTMESQPFVMATENNAPFEQIPTFNQPEETPVIYSEPEMPTPIEEEKPFEQMPAFTMEAPQTIAEPAVEIPVIGQTVDHPFVYENPQQPLPYEPEENYEEEKQQVINTNVTNSLRTAINTARDCVASIEKFGFMVDKEELDLADSYQITIKIDKTGV